MNPGVWLNARKRSLGIAAMVCATAFAVVPLVAQESARTFATPEEAHELARGLRARAVA